MKRTCQRLIKICIFICMFLALTKIPLVAEAASPKIKLTAGSTGGTSCTFKAETVPANAAVKWTSSNTSVATVSEGKVTAKTPGTTTIKATMTQNGVKYYATAAVKVTIKKTYGSWSSWTTNAISATSTREVRTTTLYRYYYFYCPVCGGREPFTGISDCHKYTLSSSDGHVGWFTTPYSQCAPRSYSYTTIKKYTTSLGDGKIWNFSTGNLNDTAIGTLDYGGGAVVITKGYSSRSVSTTNCISSAIVKKVNPIETVKLSATRLAYKGKARKPSVIVKDSAGNKVSSSYYTVTYAKGRKNVGKYKVTIKFKGKYSGTYTRYFKIVPKKTSIKSTAKTKNSITVKWYKRTKQTTGYEIRYSRYKDFSSYGKKRLAAKYTSKKITGLKAGTKYYIKIRTYKKVNGTRIYSGWSDVKTVTTKAIVYTPKSIESRWVKSGSYSYKYNSDHALLYKNSKGTIIEITDDWCGKAIAVGPKVYFIKYNDSAERMYIYSYNVNTKTQKTICKANTIGESLSLLGYYKNNIYYSIGNFPNENVTTYKLNINTGNKTKISKLLNADEAVQVGKYLVAGSMRGDPSPYTMKIYNLATGKIVKSISNCYMHKKINGKLYYIKYVQLDNFGKCKYKVYKCNMNGENSQFLTTVQSYAGCLPAIGKNYVYYGGDGGMYYKKKYSTDTISKATEDEYFKVINEM